MGRTTVILAQTKATILILRPVKFLKFLFLCKGFAYKNVRIARNRITTIETSES
jgi:hypothetical protein